jgi:hypothetical protein
MQVKSTGRESVPFILGTFKSYTNSCGGSEPGGSNNEQVERSMGGSQPGAGGLAHPGATYMSPKLFLLLACHSVPVITAIQYA